MEQYEFYITDLQRVLRKRYKIVILTVILSLGFSVFFVKIKAPLYKSSATVKVDRASMMGMGTESMLYYGTWDNIETETKVITSFPVLLRAAKRLKLIEDTIPSNTYPSDGRILSVLHSLRSKINTSLTGNTNIIRIESQSNEPKKSSDLANAIALSYRDFSIYGKKLHATNTKQFIDGQLDRCQRELSDAEYAVRSFEEQQEIPSISENSRVIIQKALKVQEEFKSIDEAATIIKMQERKLKKFHTIKDLVKKFTGVNQDKVADSLETDTTSIRMGWVSEFTDKDQGLQQLNRRLLQLQIQLADQVSFYRKDHPANKEIEKRIRETTDQILGEYEKKRDILADKKGKLTEESQEIERELRRIPSNQMSYSRLLRRLEVNEELYNVLTQKLQEAMITEAGIVDDVTIMSLATIPGNPVNKNVARVASIGILFGIILGLIFSILREVLDTSIGTIEEVERTIKLPVLAVIPHILDETAKSKSHRLNKKRKELSTSVKPNKILVTQLLPKDPSLEAFRILRTNMEYLVYDKQVKTILITSATMQEGKSTITANLGIVLAQEGKRVLLVGCNLRRPSMFRLFGVERGPGTADILIEKAKWQDCVKSVTDLVLGGMSMDDILKVPGLENLHIITYGQKPPNPVDLLTSEKMDNFFNELKKHYDVILVDAPPLLPVADSIVLAKKVDGVFLVYKVGKVPRSSLRLSKERLEAVSANILGVILNDIKPETSGFPHAYIYYQYKEHGKKEAVKKHT